ncbi:hypothetical protein A2U01_0075281, partial [Trifolium medium]|nr:hypothetical protein [Trifolium medium]
WPSLKNPGQQDTRVAIVPDEPRLRKEAEALRGPDHLGEEMIESKPEEKRECTSKLHRGDTPLGGAHREEIHHLLGTTVDILQSRRNATKDLYRGES